MKNNRIESIDLLRGIVMVLMALDHTRAFLHYDSYFFSPTDISQTTVPLFITRFITHFCAPVFVFLAGTSAYLSGRRKNKKELSTWLIKRGVWLVILELTIVQFVWQFQLDYAMNVLQVIWVLGVSMIFLAAFIYVPKRLMITVSLIVIFGHNALDGFEPETWNGLWTILHLQAPIVTKYFAIMVFYPLVPWVFVMPLGYHFGVLYTQDFDPIVRKKYLIYLGLTAIGLFFIIRALNFYGDPNSWSNFESLTSTILSFMNVSKYPPSLLYLLITLGPSILLLAFVENCKGRIHHAIVIIGRVPLFFYVVHLFVIHLVALIIATIMGFSPRLMVIELFISLTKSLQGFGFNLVVVYILAIAITLTLYPLCIWFWKYKNNNRDKWWLSYL
ncbi:DUF1624 domain-containing protein [Maribacter stanieri]|uniref:DUF1624 domain-containing protein n=1 Tax=Maribacter stanieri TaxID=440514 RepID=UPI0030D7998C|tara:strand:- start:2234 stop:3397 length:1164 start_codon:yes stop_codon:yes gene_type:complete